MPHACRTKVLCATICMIFISPAIAVCDLGGAIHIETGPCPTGHRVVQHGLTLSDKSKWLQSRLATWYERGIILPWTRLHTMQTHIQSIFSFSQAERMHTITTGSAYTICSVSQMHSQCTRSAWTQTLCLNLCMSFNTLPCNTL